MLNTIKVELNHRFLKGFLLIFSAVLISTIFDQFLNRQIDALIRSPQGLSNMIFFWGAVSLISTLFFPMMISLLCSQTLANPSRSARKLFTAKFELGLVETLRAWGKTFLWCFLLIIPGVIAYIFYMMVPYVVFFSKRYEAGEVDALNYSVQLTKRYWWKLVIWIILFYFCLPVLTSSLLDEYKLFSLFPVSATLCVLLETLIVLLFHYFILKLFFKYLNEVENGAVI